MKQNRSLVIFSRVDELDRVVSFIDDLKDNFELTENLYGNIMISVTEAVNNAIKHGNQYNENKKVTIEVDKSDSTLTFRISDEGEGFDPENLPDPLAEENLYNDSGRGVFIMKEMADKVDYSEDGSCVHLTFKL